MNTKRIVIIGGGPTGLGAAYRLHELGYDNWTLYEKHDYVGGHASSHVDAHGFVWDEGGHVIFSHYPYFDKLIDDMLGQAENQLDSRELDREGRIVDTLSLPEQLAVFAEISSGELFVRRG